MAAPIEFVVSRHPLQDAGDPNVREPDFLGITQRARMPAAQADIYVATKSDISLVAGWIA